MSNPVSSAHSTADSRRWNSAPVLAHTVPFAAWLVLMLGLEYVGSPGAWKYAVRTAVTTGLVLAYRPWRWYERPRATALLPALFAGVLVFAIWVLPEMRFGERMPLLQELYLRFGILPLGRLPGPVSSSIYAPDVCGWGLTLVRLLGSALVIASVEEFFWRGFLYRRLIETGFLAVPLGRFDTEAFWITCVLFGLEHQRVWAGVAAGVVYGILMVRTRDLWAAIIAHVVTNLLLGLYVMTTGSYAFW